MVAQGAARVPAWVSLAPGALGSAGSARDSGEGNGDESADAGASLARAAAIRKYVRMALNKTAVIEKRAVYKKLHLTLERGVGPHSVLEISCFGQNLKTTYSIGFTPKFLTT
jgi:hypothetical protein